MTPTITGPYEQVELDRQRVSDLRERRVEQAQAVAPDLVERPDVEEGHAYRLRTFAAALMAQRTCWQARADGEGAWRTRINDSAELRGFAKQAADALEPIIASVLAAAEKHEELSNVTWKGEQHDSAD